MPTTDQWPPLVLDAARRGGLSRSLDSHTNVYRGLPSL